MLRKQGDEVTTRVCDYCSMIFPSLGTLSPPETNEKTESPYARLYRSSIEDLPGPHTLESIFKSYETEQLYCDMYQGQNVVVLWCHWFESDKQLNTASHGWA